MKIEKSHIVDKGDKDAEDHYSFYYEYYIYNFSNDSITYIARSYTGEPKEAHFLRKEIKSSQQMISESDLSDSLFRKAVEHLIKEGKEEINYLGETGYQPIADVEVTDYH